MSITRNDIQGGIESHPVVVGIVSIRERIVPAVQQASVKFDVNRPDKFIKQTIANNCSSLSNKLRKIIQTGDCGLYVLLRNQLKNFMAICQKFIIPANDIRPLMQLQEEIENCDKAVLIQNGIAGLKELISQTNYLPREREGGDIIENRWTALEATLLEVRELARETSTRLGEVEQLMDAYYAKYVDGLLVQIEEKEDLIVREGQEAFKQHNTFYGYGRGTRIVEDPEITRPRLMCDIIGHTSDGISEKLLAKIKEHTNTHPIRVGRMTYKKLSEGHLNWYNWALERLQGLKPLSTEDKSRIENEHRGIIEDGSECLKVLKPAIQSMVLVRENLTDADDIAFLNEMEELLMKLHLNTIQSCIAIRDILSGGLTQIVQRLSRMQGDIQRVCFRNTRRVPVWSQWHKNLSAQIPTSQSVRGFSPPGARNGGAFGNDRQRKV